MSSGTRSGDDRLAAYRRKRDFRRTPEPAPGARPRRTARRAPAGGGVYVLHKHAASRLHFDLRLEHGGVLKSWAVPRGPSLDPGERRLAIRVEDHPLEYGDFEGVIPEGEYGAGAVIVWDRGRWIPRDDAASALDAGRLAFRLEGERLAGVWRLIRTGEAGDREQWLLVKVDDEAAAPGAGDVAVQRHETSVVTGRTLDEVASSRDRLWSGTAGELATGEARIGLPDPSAVEGARHSATSRGVAPQLATRAVEPPSGDDWLHELKYDGYRLIAHRSGNRVVLRTRRDLDWTRRFPTLKSAVAALPVNDVVLDGEVVALKPDGTADFQRLQNELSLRRDADLVYFVFDLLRLEGYDLVAASLEARKRALSELLLAAGDAAGPIRYSDHVIGSGVAFFRQACRHGVEGIVAKRRRARYRSGRSRDWLKVKCARQHEYVVAGYTDPGGSRRGFGALVLGAYDADGRLVHVGRVGTGFTGQSLRELHRRLRSLERKSPPFRDAPGGRGARGVHWVRPILVASVAFTGWTGDGLLRHPSFKGLREDVDARDVALEDALRETRPEPEPSRRSDGGARERSVTPRGRRKARTGKVRVSGVELSNPDRVLYPELGLTKADLARYFRAVSRRMMSHLSGRPLMVLRCPQGREQDCFVQKHRDDAYPDVIGGVVVPERDGQGVHMTVNSTAGLVYLAQIACLEIHVWGARERDIHHPDRLVFDLDPGSGVTWDHLREGAGLVREHLGALGLRCYLMSTGGKGLHVVAPLEPKHDWSVVSPFARGVAESVARRQPDRYTIRMAHARRKGRVFIDYLRNARGATAVAPYSTRARPGAPVAVPLGWDALERSRPPGPFSVRDLDSVLPKKDPWVGYHRVRQSLDVELVRTSGSNRRVKGS